PLREVLGDRPRVELELVAGTAAEHVLDTQEVPRFSGRFADLTAALARWRVEGFTVRLVVADELQAEHLRQILRDHDVGALVAPEDHGIGRYVGLRTMSVGDRDGDFLELEYTEGGRLYVPVERLDLVSKYLGGDAGTAKLDRLGGASWQRVKESVRAALREMAEGLLRLYAQRAVADGHAFAADTPWQREFEADRKSTRLNSSHVKISHAV